MFLFLSVGSLQKDARDVVAGSSLKSVTTIEEVDGEEGGGEGKLAEAEVSTAQEWPLMLLPPDALSSYG